MVLETRVEDEKITRSPGWGDLVRGGETGIRPHGQLKLNDSPR